MWIRMRFKLIDKRYIIFTEDQNDVFSTSIRPHSSFCYAEFSKKNEGSASANLNCGSLKKKTP